VGGTTWLHETLDRVSTLGGNPGREGTISSSPAVGRFSRDLLRQTDMKSLNSSDQFQGSSRLGLSSMHILTMACRTRSVREDEETMSTRTNGPWQGGGCSRAAGPGPSGWR
jgi:hypothetical protein